VPKNKSPISFIFEILPFLVSLVFGVIWLFSGVIAGIPFAIAGAIAMALAIAVAVARMATRKRRCITCESPDVVPYNTPEGHQRLERSGYLAAE